MQIITQKELVALAPDVTTRTEALNFLLGTVSSTVSPKCLLNVGLSRECSRRLLAQMASFPPIEQ
jgi:hypothetical protein